MNRQQKQTQKNLERLELSGTEQKIIMFIEIKEQGESRYENSQLEFLERKNIIQ